jgi:hypothetical protein
MCISQCHAPLQLNHSPCHYFALWLGPVCQSPCPSCMTAHRQALNITIKDI